MFDARTPWPPPDPEVDRKTKPIGLSQTAPGTPAATLASSEVYSYMQSEQRHGGSRLDLSGTPRSATLGG